MLAPILALATAALAGGPGPAAEPNLVLVTLDTVRADHCSLYGYERPTTPFLDRLGAEGVVFDAAYAPMAVTGPSHGTLFASRSPVSLGLHRNGLTLADTAMLAGVLADRGYVTAGFVGSFVLNRRFGFDRGFAHFDDDLEGGTASMTNRRWEGLRVDGSFDRTAVETNRRVTAWLRSQRPAGPVFLWVHYFDAHGPHTPAPGYAARFPPTGGDGRARIAALYDAEIRSVDDQLAHLAGVVERHLGDNTLVVVVGDHGEGFMDHGWPGHGPLIYEEDVRVPLVLHWPGRIPAGGRVDHPVGLVDLAPTVLDLLGVDEHPGSFRGRSWAGAVSGGGGAVAEHPVYFIRRTYAGGSTTKRVLPWAEDTVTLDITGVKYGVRRGRWKYIEAPEEGTRELYSLTDDPGETTNLVGAEPAVARRLSEELAAWHREQLAAATGEARPASAEDIEALRALGYVD